MKKKTASVLCNISIILLLIFSSSQVMAQTIVLEADWPAQGERSDNKQVGFSYNGPGKLTVTRHFEPVLKYGNDYGGMGGVFPDCPGCRMGEYLKMGGQRCYQNGKKVNEMIAGIPGRCEWDFFLTESKRYWGTFEISSIFWTNPAMSHQEGPQHVKAVLSYKPDSSTTRIPVAPADSGKWKSVGTGDCPGRDVSRSSGANPDPAKCTDTFRGQTAVCWEQVCTYKNIATRSCTGGANPGRMYTCEPAERIGSGVSDMKTNKQDNGCWSGHFAGTDISGYAMDITLTEIDGRVKGGYKYYHKGQQKNVTAIITDTAIQGNVLRGRWKQTEGIITSGSFEWKWLPNAKCQSFEGSFDGMKYWGKMTKNKSGGRQPISQPPATSVTGKESVIFFNGNDAGVSSGGRSPHFNIDRPVRITFLFTYHHGYRGVPGTIRIVSSTGAVMGTWKASGRSGSPSSSWYWEITPNVELQPGSYQVETSNPSSWSQNAGSGGNGMVQIKGVYLNP